MRGITLAGAGTTRTFTVHVRPNETSWSLSVYGLNGGRAEVPVIDQVESVARTLIRLALNLPDEAFDVVVKVLADAGSYWMHPEARSPRGAPSSPVGVGPTPVPAVRGLR